MILLRLLIIIMILYPFFNNQIRQNIILASLCHLLLGSLLCNDLDQIGEEFISFLREIVMIFELEYETFELII